MDLTDSEKKEVARFLHRYRKSTMSIESLIDEKQRLESSIMSLTANIDGNGGGGSSSDDKMATNIARLVDICDQIDKEVDTYQAARSEVRRVVDRVWEKNQVLGMDLHYRYIDFRSPFATANDIGCSTGYERKIHAKALALAYRFM